MRLIIIGILLLLISILIFLNMNKQEDTNFEQKIILTKTQNYLSTPYLANPNALDTKEKELEIIQIDEQLNTT